MRYSAVVEADADVPLSFRIPGYVVGLMQVRGENGRMRDLAEGDRVRKGSVLVRIRSTEYQDRVRQAQSHADAADALAQRAQLDFDRATRLYGDREPDEAGLRCRAGAVRLDAGRAAGRARDDQRSRNRPERYGGRRAVRRRDRHEDRRAGCVCRSGRAGASRWRRPMS